MVSFRKLTGEDAQLLSEIGRRSLLESHGHSAPAEVMEAYVDKSFSEATCRDELLDESNIFYAVYYNNEPAGYYKIILNKRHPAVALQPATYLERLYLLKEFYDLKLGHQLMHHAVELSKAQGEKGMWLAVWQKNDRALRFYQKQGFESVAEGKFNLDAGHQNPTWIMLLTY